MTPPEQAPPTDLINFLHNWKPRSILVVGDFMLDQTVFGNAERLSPDAPVPVLAVDGEKHTPGGAANVCMDLRALRCDVTCVGVVGSDSTASLLRSAMVDAGCDDCGLLASDDRPTTIKQSYVGLAQHRHPQKMFRVDRESRQPVPEEVAQRLLQVYARKLKHADAVCLEDYNKGVLSESLCRKMIALARKQGVPVLIDPAAIRDYSKYAGATTITPNRTEAELATGLRTAGGADLPTLRRISRKLMRNLELDAVVLTLDKHGALLHEREGKPVLVPTQARQVYDVTGAGDMVLAMLAGAIANGADWLSAVRLANTAAGLEVEKFGVVPIPLEEVMLSLLRQQREQLGKIRTLNQLLPELKAHRDQGRRIAFTNGCFDILHAGHVSYLRTARTQGDLLVVAINSDDSVRRLKGEGRPVNPQGDRAVVLSELQSVDYIVVFDEDTPIPLLERIKPDVLIKGGDYTRQQVVGGDLVESLGGKVVLVDPLPGRSTTHIIRKVSRQTHAAS